jgi:hypothetical protein
LVYPEILLAYPLRFLFPVASKKNRLADTENLLIHELRNCVHLINMELDLAERGVKGKIKYADLISAVDFMNRSLEDLRVRLEKSMADCENDRRSSSAQRRRRSS